MCSVDFTFCVSVCQLVLVCPGYDCKTHTQVLVLMTFSCWSTVNNHLLDNLVGLCAVISCWANFHFRPSDLGAMTITAFNPTKRLIVSHKLMHIAITCICITLICHYLLLNSRRVGVWTDEKVRGAIIKLLRDHTQSELAAVSPLSQVLAFSF